MGRGRAKAKQIKVARKLKYSAPSTDLSALERELRASRGDSSENYSSVDDVDDVDMDDDADDATYASPDEDEDEDDAGPWASNGHR